MTTLRTIAVLAIATAGLCPAQPRFEVASIKPSPTHPTIRYVIDDHRIDIAGIQLSGLVSIAFDVPPWRLTTPDWTMTEFFDVLATLPNGSAKPEIPQMLQALLAERFGLVVHHESKEQQVYALIQDKNGAKLADAAADNNDHTFAGRLVLYKMDTPEGDGYWSISVKDGKNVFDGERITMAELAQTLTQRGYFDDPVVDMTGLKGYWQLRVEVPKNNIRSEARAVAMGAPDDPDGVSLPAQLRKLGLDLEHRKAPVDHLVVDHIERQPTEN